MGPASPAPELATARPPMAQPVTAFSKFLKLLRIAFLIGTPGLIFKLFQDQPTALQISGFAFGSAASALGTTTPEWRMAQLTRKPVAPLFQLHRPYWRMAAMAGVIALLLTVWCHSLIGTLSGHPMLNTQLYFFPATLWGSAFSFLVLGTIMARQR